jgi:hypothetical protein
MKNDMIYEPASKTEWTYVSCKDFGERLFFIEKKPLPSEKCLPYIKLLGNQIKTIINLGDF